MSRFSSLFELFYKMAEDNYNIVSEIKQLFFSVK